MNFVLTKAQQVNSNLDDGKFSTEAAEFSALVSNIVTTKEAFDIFRWRFPLAFLFVRKSLKHVFYL